MTLYHSTFRRFDASSCKATPVIQLITVFTILITACRTFTLTDVLLLGTLWAFDGLREHSLSWNDKVNAGVKLPECTSASQSPIGVCYGLGFFMLSRCKFDNSIHLLLFYVSPHENNTLCLSVNNHKHKGMVCMKYFWFRCQIIVRH